jgi:hypothetical protein
LANELTITASLSFSKGEFSALLNKTGIQLDVAGEDYVEMSQLVLVTEAALDLGAITTPGYILMYNPDTTNFVEIRPATGVADCVKIPAGGIALFMNAAVAPFIISDTASVRVYYLLIEA